MQKRNAKLLSLFPFLLMGGTDKIREMQQDSKPLLYKPNIIHENPIFIPRKHTVQSYRTQNRLAKARRKSKHK